MPLTITYPEGWEDLEAEAYPVDEINILKCNAIIELIIKETHESYYLPGGQRTCLMLMGKPADPVSEMMEWDQMYWYLKGYLKAKTESK